MKILAEEIVKRYPAEVDKGPGKRYRRSTIGLLDCPEEMLLSIQDGRVLTIDGHSNDISTKRRKLVIAAVRMAALLYSEEKYVGLIIDLIDPELYKAIDEDDAMPADYVAFCKLEGIEP